MLHGLVDFMAVANACVAVLAGAAHDYATLVVTCVLATGLIVLRQRV